MKKFSIVDIERFTGIRAHTFRIWEQRYNFPKAKRTGTNFRFYDLEDLKPLLEIALLNQFGHKISYLNQLSPEAVRELVDKHSDDPCFHKALQVNYLILSMYETDVEDFERILDYCTIFWGIHVTIEDIILPFIDKVELLYYTDKSNETHFAVTALRRKLILGIENARPAQKEDCKALFFLPEGEHFDLILLFMQYALKTQGFITLYLGTDTPMENLKHIMKSKSPQFLLTYLVPKSKFGYEQLSLLLSDQHYPFTLVLAGFTERFSTPGLPSKVRLMHHRNLKSGWTLGNG